MSVLRFWFSEAAGDHAEFEQPAFDGAIEQGNAAGRSEAKHTGQIHVGGENLHRPTAKVLFQVVAELRIKGLE